MSEKISKGAILSAMTELNDAAAAATTPEPTAAPSKTKIKSGQKGFTAPKGAIKTATKAPTPPKAVKVEKVKAPKVEKPPRIAAKDQKFFADIKNQRGNVTKKNGKEVIMSVFTTSGRKALITVSDGNKISMSLEGDWEVSNSKM
jgi:hypothetical protein